MCLATLSQVGSANVTPCLSFLAQKRPCQLVTLIVYHKSAWLSSQGKVLSVKAALRRAGLRVTVADGNSDITLLA